MVRPILTDLFAFAFTLPCYLVFRLGFLFHQEGRKYSSHLVRSWAKLMLWLAGVKLRIKNPERFNPAEPRVLVVNHSSWLDIPVLLAAFPSWLVMAAKDSLAKAPIIGCFLQQTGHLFINRAKPRLAIATLLEAAERIQEEQLTVMVFPEGTRSYDGKLQALHEGAFELAVKAGIPVQPVAILGTHAIMPKHAIGPLKRGVVEVRVGSPIAMSASRKHLVVQTRAALISLGVST